VNCLHCSVQIDIAKSEGREREVQFTKDDKGKHVPKHTSSLGPKLATYYKLLVHLVIYTLVRTYAASPLVPLGDPKGVAWTRCGEISLW